MTSKLDFLTTLLKVRACHIFFLLRLMTLELDGNVSFLDIICFIFALLESGVIIVKCLEFLSSN